MSPKNSNTRLESRQAGPFLPPKPPPKRVPIRYTQAGANVGAAQGLTRRPNSTRDRFETALDPIAQVASDPPLIVSNKNLRAHNLAEFIEWLKAAPDTATQGTGGAGSVSHVLGVFFQKRTNTRFQFVPYRSGVGMAMQDMVAGHIDFLFSVAANAVLLLRAGTIKGYAVTSKERLGVVPEIPTVDEAGFPGFYMSNWHGIWASKGISPSIREALNATVVETLADPGVHKKLVDLGQEVAPPDRQTPDGLASLHRAEIEKWWPIIREAGVRLE